MSIEVAELLAIRVGGNLSLCIFKFLDFVFVMLFVLKSSIMQRSLEVIGNISRKLVSCSKATSREFEGER